jgi:hypothetical protein
MCWCKRNILLGLYPPSPTTRKRTQSLKPDFSEVFILLMITDKYKQSNENIAEHAKLIIILNL